MAKLTATVIVAGVYPEFDYINDLGYSTRKGGFISLLWQAPDGGFQTRVIQVSRARAEQERRKPR